ncbi:MAG: hypothetical protein AUH85_02730 [Chloroflexi bacterium 13_1_40CM_4_68_4]|nr:MAG: hypothetical protein AUH85_02730 [Chloroflexi bacterium 13_1_40CM_4_68_4]
MRGALVALVAALSATALTIFAMLYWSSQSPVGTATTVVRSAPSVVVAVRDLARLESAQYHVERVIELRDRQSRFFGLVTAEDAILLVAVGEVTAGVDLSLLRDADVVVDSASGTARVTLPAAQVLSTRLDNDQTWIYSRTTDLLAQRHEDLETRARQEAERTLEQSALERGILDRARTNAERTIESLIRSLGYTYVTVVWREADLP